MSTEFEFDAKVKEADDIDIKEYSFSPTLLENGVIDYSNIEHDKIFLVNKHDILEKEKPDWIPELDLDGLMADEFLPTTIKSSDGYYYVQTRKFTGMELSDPIKLTNRERSLSGQKSIQVQEKKYETTIYKMSSDILAATVDYYIKKQKALNKQIGKKATVGLPRRTKSMYTSRFQNMVDLLRFIPEYKENEALLKHYTNRNKSEAYRKQNKIIFDQYNELLQNLKDKILDLNLDKIDYGNAYTKGEITSYGDTGLSNSLYEDFGVRIKKQNGSTFSLEQKNRVESVLKDTYSYYGDLSNISKDFNLKVSYADNCNQHARKYIGLFSPYHNAIGVSFFDDNTYERTTAAHEFAHFLDYIKGNEFSYRYASDKDGSLENQIATKYKKLIREQNENNKSKVGESKTIKLGDYWYRTCECFARAIEQDFELTIGLKEKCEPPAYLQEEIFNKEIKPLIEELKKENEIKLNLIPGKFVTLTTKIKGNVMEQTKEKDYETLENVFEDNKLIDSIFQTVSKEFNEKNKDFFNFYEEEKSEQIENLSKNISNIKEKMLFSKIHSEMLKIRVEELKEMVKRCPNKDIALAVGIRYFNYFGNIEGNISHQNLYTRFGIGHYEKDQMVYPKPEELNSFISKLYENSKTQETYIWNHYDDSSCCLKAPNGEEYFVYDPDADEVKITKDSNWIRIDELNLGDKTFTQYAEDYVLEKNPATYISFETNGKNIEKEQNVDESKQYSFFVKDTAEFEQFAEIKTKTNLSAKKAIEGYKSLRAMEYSAGVGIHIPTDTAFNDPKGLGTTILVRENGIDTFDIYGDSFIVDLKENNERTQNRIAAYKELYEEAKAQGLNVKEPTFLFEKERELGLPNKLTILSGEKITEEAKLYSTLEQNVLTETCFFDGKEYFGRYVEIEHNNGEKETLLMYEDSLGDIVSTYFDGTKEIVSEEDKKLSSQAQSIDEDIYCYVPKDILTQSNEVVIKWCQENNIDIDLGIYEKQKLYIITENQSVRAIKGKDYYLLPTYEDAENYAERYRDDIKAEWDEWKERNTFYSPATGTYIRDYNEYGDEEDEHSPYDDELEEDLDPKPEKAEYTSYEVEEVDFDDERVKKLIESNNYREKDKEYLTSLGLFRESIELETNNEPSTVVIPEAKQDLNQEIPRVLNYFGSKYELFYDSYPADGQIIHNNNVYDKENVLKLEKELVFLFDSQMKENEIFKTFVQNTAKERGDIFSSDKECAALLMTIKEIGLEKELGFEIPELKRNEIATLLQIELNQSKITEKEIINRVEKGKNLVKSYFFEHWKDDKEKGVFDLWATHDAMRYVGFNLEIQNYENGKYVDVYNQEEKKELEKINQTMKNLLNEYSSELIERMNNNSNKFLFIFEKLQAAGIEVVFDKEEFDRILEREKLLQKMTKKLSEFEDMKKELLDITQRREVLNSEIALSQEERIRQETEADDIEFKNFCKTVKLLTPFIEINKNNINGTWYSEKIKLEFLSVSTNLNDDNFHAIEILNLFSRINGNYYINIYSINELNEFIFDSHKELHFFDPYEEKIISINSDGEINDTEIDEKYLKVLTEFKKECNRKNFTKQLEDTIYEELKKKIETQRVALEKDINTVFINKNVGILTASESNDLKQKLYKLPYVELNGIKVYANKIDEVKPSQFLEELGLANILQNHDYDMFILPEQYTERNKHADTLANDEFLDLKNLSTKKVRQIGQKFSNAKEQGKNVFIYLNNDFSEKEVVDEINWRILHDLKIPQANIEGKLIIMFGKSNQYLEYKIEKDGIQPIKKDRGIPPTRAGGLNVYENIPHAQPYINISQTENKSTPQNFITQDGTTYGFAFNGKIYLNPEIISSEAALHEYTHLWDNYTKVTNPELWQKGKEIFKNTNLWEEVKNEPNYQDIAHDEDLILSECHARITGKIADKILDKIQKENGELTKDTVIDWNKEVFEYISKEFVDKDIDIQSVSEFVSQTMKDFMEGRVMPKIDSYRINHNHDYFLSQKAIEFRIEQAKALTKAFFVENWEQSNKEGFVQKAIEYTLEPNSTVLFDKSLKENEVDVYTKEEQEKMEQANNSIIEYVKQYSNELFEEYGKEMKENVTNKEETKLYRYYTKRPVDIGTVPKEFKSFENYDYYKYNEDAGRQVYGFVEYDRELSEVEIKEFELFKPNPFREIKIEPTKENGLKETYVLFGRVGAMEGTTLSNYDIPIQNGNKINNFNAFDSFEEAIRFVENGFKPLSQEKTLSESSVFVSESVSAGMLSKYINSEEYAVIDKFRNYVAERIEGNPEDKTYFPQMWKLGIQFCKENNMPLPSVPDEIKNELINTEENKIIFSDVTVFANEKGKRGFDFKVYVSEEIAQGFNIGESFIISGSQKGPGVQLHLPNGLSEKYQINEDELKEYYNLIVSQARTLDLSIFINREKNEPNIPLMPIVTIEETKKIKKEELELPFSIINNVEKGRINIKFDQKISDKKFNSILKELKSAGWKFSSYNKQWYPVGKAVEKSESFVKELQEKYSKSEERITYATASFGEFSQTELQNQKSPYDGIRFFDRNYKELDEFVAYFNKNLEAFGKDVEPIDENIAETIFESLQVERSGILNSRNIRLGLDASNNLILLNKEKSDIETKKITLKELLFLAKETLEKEKQSLDEMLENFNKKDNKEQFISVFGNLFQSAKDNNTELINKMKIIYESYIKEPTEHTKKISKIDLCPVTKYNFKNKLKQICEIDKHFNHDVLIMGKQLLSLATEDDKKEISKWLKDDIGCEDEESMKKVFTKWISEKEIKQEKKKDGYPPRGE